MLISSVICIVRWWKYKIIFGRLYDILIWGLFDFSAVDTSSIDNTLKKNENIEVHQVKEFCVPTDVSTVADLEMLQPRMCAFNVSQPVLDMVPELHSCYDSSTFLKLWNEQCVANNGQCTSLDDVVQQVWAPVKHRYVRLIKLVYRCRSVLCQLVPLNCEQCISLMTGIYH